MRQLYLDMDGVLADFDQHYQTTFGGLPPKRAVFDKDGHDVDWSAIEKHKDFYLGIPPMSDMSILWEYARNFQPIIITGIPSSVPEAADNKKAWVRKYLGLHVPVICCRSREKYVHASKGDVIVDDWDKYKSLWEKVGGVWITHTSAQSSINKLWEAGFVV